MELFNSFNPPIELSTSSNPTMELHTSYNPLVELSTSYNPSMELSTSYNTTMNLLILNPPKQYNNEPQPICNNHQQKGTARNDLHI